MLHPTQKSNQTCQRYFEQNKRRIIELFKAYFRNDVYCLAIIDGENTIKIMTLTESQLRNLTVGNGIKLENNFYQSAIDRINVIRSANRIPVVFIPNLITSSISLVVADLTKNLAEIKENEAALQSIADPTKVFSATDLKYLQKRQQQLFSEYIKLVEKVIDKYRSTIAQYKPLVDAYSCEDPKAIVLLIVGEEIGYIDIERLEIVANLREWTANVRAKAAESATAEELAEADREIGFNFNLLPKTKIDRELYDCLLTNCDRERAKNKTPLIIFNYVKELPTFLILGF